MEGEDPDFLSLVNEIINGDYFSYTEKLDKFPNLDYQILYYIFNDIRMLSSHSVLQINLFMKFLQNDLWNFFIIFL